MRPGGPGARAGGRGLYGSDLGRAREILFGFNQRWSAENGLAGPPARLVMRAWYNPNLEIRWFFIPGVVGILILVVTLVVTALSVARERELGTFDQLLVTPLRPWEILIGKATLAFVIGVTEASLVLLVNQLWPMAVIATATLSTATWQFRHRLC